LQKDFQESAYFAEEIVKSFPETEYFDISIENKKIILMPVKITPSDRTLEGVRDKMKRLGMTEGDVIEAVAWARKKKRR